jgi:hypothetical protein
MHGLFPHIRRSRPVCHFSCDHGRYQFLGHAGASLLLHSHSEVAYWTVCGNVVESGWLILSQKAIPHKARVPAQSPFYKRLTEKRKDGRLFHLSASKKNFQSVAVICRKPHVASSICLRATIFQNPEWTLWTHCIINSTTYVSKFSCNISFPCNMYSIHT